MKQLVFGRREWKQLQELCEQGYPKEVCGLIFGGIDGSHKVLKIEKLQNILDGNYQQRLEELLQAGSLAISRERAGRGGNFEFVIDPREHHELVLRAEKEGLDQIGVFHSHPDHPA